MKDRNHRDWSLQLLRSEIDQLEREKSHLDSKAIERELSDWESSRLRSIQNEIANICAAIRKMSASAISINKRMLAALNTASRESSSLPSH
ncbi:MAG: hypothetical protein J5J00_08310 [Deltaproteobacteria bacterium]|nr:hypothetical protein [Deltaproteobacteria bacterium]